MTSTTVPAVSLLTSADPGWDRARQTFNLAVDQQPAAIAQPGSALGVRGAVDLARRRGWRVAAQSTGHNAVPLGPLGDTLLIRTDAMRSVGINPEARTARVGAGALWQDVTDAAAAYDLTALAGSSPNVGVAGYTLGGGLSWLARTYGLAANHVTGFEAVTADGELRQVDATHEIDLFWALRGGGGSFGVVTALELELFPVTEVAAGLLWWPLDAAADVLQTWRELTQSDLPDALMTTARMMRMPDRPEMPEPIRGGSFVVIDVIFLGAETEARALLDPLLRLRPTTDTLTTVPARTLGRLHLDPEEPVPFAGDAMALDQLPEVAVDNLVRLAGPGVETTLSVVELRHLGGELRRSGPDHGALAALDAEYLLFAGSGLPSPDPAAVDLVLRGVRSLHAVLAPWAARQMYLNFAETRRDPAEFFSPEAYARLRRIKAEVDPEDRIRANHPILPAAGARPA